MHKRIYSSVYVTLRPLSVPIFQPGHSSPFVARQKLPQHLLPCSGGSAFWSVKQGWGSMEVHAPLVNCVCLCNNTVDGYGAKATGFCLEFIHQRHSRRDCFPQTSALFSVARHAAPSPCWRLALTRKVPQNREAVPNGSLVVDSEMNLRFVYRSLASKIFPNRNKDSSSTVLAMPLNYGVS